MPARRSLRPVRWPRINLLGVAVLAACGSDGPTDSDLECPAPVVITATDGVRPTVSWSPACAASSVSVFPISDGGGLPVPLWWAHSFANVIAPPVRVGDQPAGSAVIGANEPLTPGVSYVFYVAQGTRGAGLTDSLRFTARAGGP